MKSKMLEDRCWWFPQTKILLNSHGLSFSQYFVFIYHLHQLSADSSSVKKVIQYESRIINIF